MAWEASSTCFTSRPSMASHSSITSNNKSGGSGGVEFSSSSSIITILDNQKKNYQMDGISHESISTFDSNLQTVVSVNDYLSLFIWRDSFLSMMGQSSSLESLPPQDVFSEVARYNQWLKNGTFPNNGNNSHTQTELSVGLERRVKGDFMSFLKFYGISESNVKYTEFAFSGDVCRNPGNVYEEFDVIFSTLNNFYTFIRQYRDGSRKKKLINPNDFIPIPLVPTNLKLINQESINSFQMNQSALGNSYFPLFSTQDPEDCSQFVIKDTNNVLRMKQFGNVTIEDLSFIKFVRSINGNNNEQIKVNRLVFEELVRNTAITYNTTSILNESWTTQNVLSNLLPSTCHSCSTTNCIDFLFVEGDYWIIPCAILQIVYFIGLFVSKSFLKPSMKRRLIVPYFPAFVVPLELCFSSFLNNACYYFLRYLTMLMVCWVVISYTFTVIRYYYLRNLYNLMSNGKTNLSRLRYFSSSRFGILITGVLSFVLAVLFTIHGVTFFFNIHIDDTTYLNVGNASILVYNIIGCLLGLIGIIVDTVANRKIIKEKGFRSFLLYDDPFFVRIDLFLLTALIVNTIIVVVVSADPQANTHLYHFFRFLVYCCVVFICGGTVLVSEIIKAIGNIGESHARLETELETYLKNTEFQILLKEYASKEMSIENYLLYDRLQKLMKKGINSPLDLNEMKEIEKNFLRSLSSYEVNIQAVTRKNFYKLLELCENSVNFIAADKPKVNDLISVLYHDVCSNLTDTYLRICRTKEFEIWHTAYSIQKETIH